MWIQGLPFKISFSLWRLWKKKLPVDEIVAKSSIAMVSRSRCCTYPQQKTIKHLFLTGQFVKDIWTHFTAAAGVLGPFLQVNHVVSKWWETACFPKLRPLYQAAPAIILWQVWKWRNAVLYGGTMSRNRVIYEVNWNLQMLARVRYP